MSAHDDVYTIRTMADFLALSPEQRGRCVADMLVWAAFVDAVREESIFTTPDVMTWRDDYRPGEVSEIRITTITTKEQEDAK